jgi:hypothetical protein
MTDTTAGAEKWLGLASGACAVHCVVQPALVLVLPVAAAGERLEAVLVSGLILVAALLLWSGIRQHGCYRPVIPVVGASVLWGLALGDVVPELASAVLIAGGGALSFWGLSWSRGLAAKCACAAGGSERAGSG